MCIRDRLSASRPLLTDQVSFASGVLPSGITLTDSISAGNTQSNTEHYLVFSGAVANLVAANITITGSPTVTISNLSKSWYNTFTIYASAINTINGQLQTAHTNFEMRFINTDVDIPEPVAPTLSVPDRMLNENEPFRLDLTRYTSGDGPFTYERTLISVGTSRYPLPDWETDRSGTGLRLSSAGMLTGRTPRVTADEVDICYITAVNDAGRDPDIFTIRIVNVPETIPHEDPVWNIPNKRYEVGDPITINPLADGELTGTSPITISVTSIEDNPSATALPFGLSLANNIINGVAPTVTATTIRTVYLTAANIDSDGTTHKTHVTFTITVVPEPEPGDPHVNPSWNIPNKSYPEDQGFTIDPITNNELTGTSPLTITVTPTSADPNATALPSWLTQNGNIFTGAVTDVSADTDFEIYLTACLLYTSPSPRD